MTSSGRTFLTLGILNLTPDSFSDGGLYDSPPTAVDRLQDLLDHGADFVDVGAESTRPGAETVSEREEWQRLEAFLELADKKNLLTKVSVDTRKYSIMKRVAQMSVAFINCVGPAPEAEELGELRSLNPNLSFIATHMHGTPANMQLTPLSPRSAVRRVEAFFENTLADFTHAGFSRDQVFMDPGIGFGKTDSANLALLLKTNEWSARYNIAIGVSRKGFIGRVFGGNGPTHRDFSSKVIETASLAAGAILIRTHDVKGFKKAASILREAMS